MATKTMTETITRRDAMNRSVALAALAGAQLAWPSWMPRLAFAPKNSAPRGDTLVCVFMRGAADGLNVIVPHGEAAYYTARPKLAVARPDDTTADQTKRAIDLDGFFGLNPVLSALQPIFKGGQLVAVHATGSPDPTRSHFDAQDYMERGTPGNHTLNNGWLARHLNTIDTGNTSALRAVGWGTALQRSLQGSVSATAIQSIVNYHLAGRTDAAAAMLSTLNSLYGGDDQSLKAISDQTQGVLELVSKINVASYQPANGATYDAKNGYALAFMQTAALIKADVGLEVAAIDIGGWDTHQNQETDMTKAMEQLVGGLAAFHTDMGDLINKVTVVTMSEFGRRVQENASGGTDHGHGGVMFVMGGHVAQKPVITNWPTLAPDKLANSSPAGGDLAITIDYRDVLAEILGKRLNNPALDQVFPDFKPTPRGIVTA
ncbi:MAG: DUF1501 domain-containing protein [Aggregatilineales bacterium]